MQSKLKKGRVIFTNYSGFEMFVVLPILTGFRDEGRIPDTVLIFSHGKPSVCIGRYEDVDNLKYEECKRDGIQVGRRSTGAGIYLAPKGQMAAGVVTTKEVLPNIDEAERRWTGEIMTEFYRRVGIPGVWYKHPGDVKTGERKLTGSGTLSHGNAIFVTSFLNRLLPDSKFFSEYQILPKEKMIDKKVDDITKYAASIEQDAPRLLSEEEVAEVLTQVAGEKLGMELTPGKLDEWEKEPIEREVARTTSEEYVGSISTSRWYANLPRDWVAATSRFKTMKLISANVTVDREKMMREVLITGDFLISPPEGWEQIQESLRDIPANDEAQIKKAIQEVFSRFHIDYTGFTLDDLAKPVIDAARGALGKLS